jgi:hypothetical protein
MQQGSEPTPQKRGHGGGFQPRADGQPRKRGGTVKAGSRGGAWGGEADAPVDHKAAARALYESRPGFTCADVAKATAVPLGTIKRWKAEASADGRPWKPVPRNSPQLSERAGALANTFRMKMEELGKPLDDKVAVAEAERSTSLEVAVEVRAAVLDRHRKEWSAPRRLSYEAIQKRDFELAKLAKITSETLMLIQNGECRAFGLDAKARGGEGGTVVVIERENTGTGGAPAGPGEHPDFPALPEGSDGE